MAVPALMLRATGGVGGVRAGTGGYYRFGLWMSSLGPDWRLGCQPILNAQNYTSLCETVNDFL